MKTVSYTGDTEEEARTLLKDALPSFDDGTYTVEFRVRELDDGTYLASCSYERQSGLKDKIRDVKDKVVTRGPGSFASPLERKLNS